MKILPAVLLFSLLLVFSHCDEGGESVPHTFSFEIDLASDIDSAYLLLNSHKENGIKIPLQLSNGTEQVKVSNLTADSYDVAVIFFKDITDEGWSTQVTKINKVELYNLAADVHHHFNDTQLKWRTYHQFQTHLEPPTFTVTIEVSHCANEAIVTSTSEGTIDYFLYQHCYYDNDVLGDCLITEVFGKPLLKETTIELFGNEPWCQQTAFQQERLFYCVFIQDQTPQEVLLGYF